MRNYDFSPLYRSLVGFDRMAQLIDRATQVDSSKTYPPYNIEHVGEDAFAIELAVAGFSESDLDIQTKDRALIITGTKAANDDIGENRTYMHRGIAERGFERQFQLADHVQVVDANLENGLLRISLQREIPDALKPRKIDISSSARHDEKLIAGKSSRKAKAA